MDADRFWLTDEQFAKIEPFSPTDTRGRQRVDDRRLTGGQVPDCVAAQELLDKLPECAVVNGDKGYDSDDLRRKIKARGALANIPPKTNRKEKLCFSPFLYRDRNAIERMFCRLKDFRRIATRYDRNATNFLAAVCLAATVSYWL